RKYPYVGVRRILPRFCSYTGGSVTDRRITLCTSTNKSSRNRKLRYSSAFPERQIDPHWAGFRVVSGFQRSDSVIHHSRSAAPDNYVSMFQSYFSSGRASLHSSEKKRSGKSERYGDDRL